MNVLTEFFEPDLKTLISRTNETLSEQWNFAISLLDIKDKTFSNYITPSKDKFKVMDVEITQVWHLDSVRNSEELNSIQEALIPIFTEFNLRFQLDKRFYDSLIYIRDHDKTLNNEQMVYLKKQIISYELNGIHLDDSLKKQLSEINNKLSLLSTSYSKNLIEAMKNFNFPLTKDDLKSFPESELEAFTNADGTFGASSVNAVHSFMQYSNDRLKRKQIQDLFSRRGSANDSIAFEILSLRDQKSTLLGFSSYAEYTLQKRDAKSVEQVLGVFDYLTQKAMPFAKREINLLKELALSLDNITDFGAYDISYYSELYRKQHFEVDEQEYKKYFEVKNVLNGFFDFIKELSKASFILSSNKTELWHEDVLVYDLYFKREIIGRIYFDLFEREGKSSGAWKSSVTSHHKDHNGDTILSVCNVVCNFDKKNKDGLSFLTHGDVVTFFHEMGHALHHLFSTVSIESLSGTAVERDVVEFPSQFLEYFAYNADVLQKFAIHYDTKKVLSNEMIAKLNNVRTFLSGYATLRQCSYALFDMHLHKGGVPDFNETNLLVRELAAVLPAIEYDHPHQTFSHIFAGGYAAGYYSYKWAEILSAGAYNVFTENPSKQTEFFDLFRELVLETGGTVNLVDQFQKFTGKAPDVEDLLRIDGLC